MTCESPIYECNNLSLHWPTEAFIFAMLFVTETHLSGRIDGESDIYQIMLSKKTCLQTKTNNVYTCIQVTLTNHYHVHRGTVSHQKWQHNWHNIVQSIVEKRLGTKNQSNMHMFMDLSVYLIYMLFISQPKLLLKYHHD